MRNLILGSLLALTLSACTGTREPQAPFKVVVQEQTTDTEVTLKVWQVADDWKEPQSLSSTGTATGLTNTGLGNYLFAGYKDRIEVFTGDSKELAGIRKLRTLGTETDGVFKIKNCSDPIQLQKPVLNANDGFLVVLGQCGASQERQTLWAINLNSATPENWQAIELFDSLANPILFFTASSTQAFFASKNNTGGFILYAVTLLNPNQKEDSSGKPPLASTLNGLEYWNNGLRYSDGSKLGTVKNISNLELSDLVTYPASALFRKQNQLLAFSSSRGNACLLDNNPNCEEGSDVIRFVSDVRDVAFDLNGYAWMVAGSTLYRIDAVASNKQAEFRASVTNPRGVAWVVN